MVMMVVLWIALYISGRIGKKKGQHQMHELHDFMTMENRRVLAIKGLQNKTIDLDFKNVDLAKVTPSIDSLKLGGNINGKLSISQLESVYLPKSKLIIDNFKVNDFNLGSFNSNIVGDASLTNYNIEMSLLDDANESLSVYGILDVSEDDPKLNLDINFKDFILDVALLTTWYFSSSEQKGAIHQSISISLLHRRTGVTAIDEGIETLYDTGYMHNHLRMYTAAITCNIGKNHWRYPAQWMY